jgi:glyoxylase I family protein
VWNQQAGRAVFSPFPRRRITLAIGQQWIIIFRVNDLDKMFAQLEAASIAVKMAPTAYPKGRFARVHDQEGNPIELWQPLQTITLK